MVIDVLEVRKFDGFLKYLASKDSAFKKMFEIYQDPPISKLLDDFEGTEEELEAYLDELGTDWTDDLWMVYSAVYINPMDEEDYASGAYQDLQLPKSDKYLHHLDKFIELMNASGLSTYYEGYEEEVSNENYYSIFYDREWVEGGTTYELLRETGDYFWFLVAFIQNYASTLYAEDHDLHDFLNEVEANDSLDHFSVDWFTPLKTWFVRQMIEEEYKTKKQEFLSNKDAIKSVNFSELNKVDASMIPEYDLDEYIEYEGDLYEPFDVYLAITATSGLAQSLERQDLEGAVTNVSQIIDSWKKEKEKSKSGNKK